jgi:uncharacterized protein (TIGR02246 family)
MSPDERAIRELVDTWMKASGAGDTATVLSLMSDDVIFTRPRAVREGSFRRKFAKHEGLPPRRFG